MLTRNVTVMITGVVLLSGAGEGCAAPDAEPAGTPTGATCPTDSTLTYTTFGSTFFKDYCLRCHETTVAGSARNGAREDHNFESRDLVLGMKEHIDQMAGAGPAAVNTIMPKTAPFPSEADRRHLAEWLACGAP